MSSPTKEENLLDSEKSNDSSYDNLASPSYDAVSPTEEEVIDPLEREKQLQEWKEELDKVEGEIAMLRQVLGSKVRYASDLKRKLGITPFQEFKQDLHSGIQHIKGSDTYQKTNEKLHAINDKITHSSAYQKTSSAVKTASEKTSAVVSNIGGAMSRKLGDIRNSQTFKSLEERVETTYANVKAKVAGSKSANNIDETLKESEEVGIANENVEASGDDSKTPLPEEKVPL